MRELSDYLGTHKILFAGRDRKYRLVTEIYKEISQNEFQFHLITPSILGNMVSICAVQSFCTASFIMKHCSFPYGYRLSARIVLTCFRVEILSLFLKRNSYV